MTPRALLTAIGATAIGFAIAIGSVAGFAPGTTSPSSSSTAEASGQALRTMALLDTGTDAANGMGTATLLRTLSAEDDCPIAL